MIKKKIHKLIKQKKRFPTLQEMCNILNFNEEQTKKYMGALAEDGKLEKIGDWYRFRINNEIEKEESIEDVIDRSFVNIEIIPINKDNRGKMIKNKKKKATKKKLYGLPIYIIQLLMGTIGSGAAIISIYYTTIWLFEFLPWGFALLLSSIMVGFSISAFETIILFMSGQVTKSKVSKVSISISFIVLWIIVTFFSIMSTVAGQYNKHVANLKTKVKIEGTENISYSLIKEQKKELLQRLSEYRNQISTLNKLISSMSDIKSRNENNKLWKESQYRLYYANKNIQRVNKELNKLRKKESEIIKISKKKGTILTGINTKKEIPNFYGWLSGIFSVDEDKVQFSMSLFPAIFVDIISPIGIALALFLRNRYK